MSGFELKTKDGRSFRIEKEWTRFGRSDDNDLVMRDPAVSRHHLNLYIKDGQLIIEDAGSQNGFLLNGQPASAAVSVAHGDKIFVGTTEYMVLDPNRPAPVYATAKPAATANTNSGTGSPASFTANFNRVSNDDERRKKMRLYAYGAVILVLFAIAMRDGEKKSVNDAGGRETGATQALESKGYRPDTYRTRSVTEIQSSAKFREAMREYDNANYGRAQIAFQESRTLNPENDEALKYMELSEGRLAAQLSELLKDSNASMSNLQYRRAKGQAARVLTILSEQIPGYGRKLAQESMQGTEGRRPAGQEETLMGIPCSQTRDEKSCAEALNIIREARKQLGEEDVLR